jgi:hypothetical protein
MMEQLEKRLKVLNEILKDISLIIEENDVESQEEHNSLCKLLDKYYSEKLSILTKIKG